MEKSHLAAQQPDAKKADIREEAIKLARALSEFKERKDVFEVNYDPDASIERKNALGYFLRQCMTEYPVLSCENEKCFLICYKSSDLNEFKEDLCSYSMADIVVNIRACEKHEYSAPEVREFFDDIARTKTQILDILTYLAMR
ncbi:hypothetical protein M5216_004429 [Vibrio vulnificus]|nr:hypothetical protein [Vibrio vulnificus]